ncbi:transcription factor RelB [Spea bombifrons]|uniref:transcription factor RelB n=1 Tax=Spea bombifrons TaxID=233779 RepID=UPI0023499405|nr:transcription factor RelB [Spea bombifrons]
MKDGRPGPHALQDQQPTLDEVMEYIGSHLQSDDLVTTSSTSAALLPRVTDILDTVTVASWVPPQEAIPHPWTQLPEAPPPALRITEQPKQRGMRFRYQCEGRSAGSILGERSTDHNKTLPAIELDNCDHLQEVCVRVCLVWKDHPYRVHPHGLVGKDCHGGICEVILRPREGMTQHSFSNLGIQCVRKKEIETSVKDRLRLGIDPYNAGMWRHHEEVDLNVVRLCFQASYPGPGGEMIRMSPVLSEPVYDKKSTNTSELKICRMNKESGRCDGGEEIYILCDKVQKEDIQVVFTDGVWEARADFAQADVHRQIAIVLKTPPYGDLEITQPAQVLVFLQRITDRIRSEGMPYTYLPRMRDLYGLQDKKRRFCLEDDMNGPDPHGIEAKRNRVAPSYMDHYSPVQGKYWGLMQQFQVPDNHESWLNLPPEVGDDLTGPIQATLDADTINLDHLPDYFFQDGAFSGPAPMDAFNSTLDNGATANLVGFSLALTEEEQEGFPSCSYTS